MARAGTSAETRQRVRVLCTVDAHMVAKRFSDMEQFAFSIWVELAYQLVIPHVVLRTDMGQLFAGQFFLLHEIASICQIVWLCTTE